MCAAAAVLIVGASRASGSWIDRLVRPHRRHQRDRIRRLRPRSRNDAARTGGGALFITRMRRGHDCGRAGAGLSPGASHRTPLLRAYRRRRRSRGRGQASGRPATPAVPPACRIGLTTRRRAAGDAGLLDALGHVGYVHAATRGSMGVAAALVAIFPGSPSCSPPSCCGSGSRGRNWSASGSAPAASSSSRAEHWWRCRVRYLAAGACRASLHPMKQLELRNIIELQKTLASWFEKYSKIQSANGAVCCHLTERPLRSCKTPRAAGPLLMRWTALLPPCGMDRGARTGGGFYDGQRYDDRSGYGQVRVSGPRRGYSGGGGRAPEADPRPVLSFFESRHDAWSGWRPAARHTIGLASSSHAVMMCG